MKPCHNSTASDREPVVALVELRGALHRRGPEQPAVEGVVPVVVGALERARVPLAVADLHRAVLTHRGQRTHLAGLVTHDDDRFVHDRDGEPVAHLGDPFGTTDAEPLLGVHRLAFEREHLR
jgi:hypothetical protein